MKIAWSVKLPEGAKLKIKEGKSVEAGEVVYEFHQNIVERLPLIGWQDFNSGERKTVLQNIIKKDLVEDEVLGKGGWFSSLVLKSPGKGKCLGVDEFGNIELEKEKEEKYLAPISAKKVRVEKDKVIFELKGDEFEAEGVNQHKAWGDFDNQIFNDLDQISNKQANKIIMVENSLEAAIKAEAIGVAGLILIDVDKFKEFEDSDIPVVLMKKDELIKLIKNDGVKIWLNATAGKVLVVLE